MSGITFEIKHRINHMFEHARTCNRTVLGHMPNNEGRDIFPLGQMHQPSGALADLTNAARSRFQGRRKNRLDRVDHQKSRFKLSDPFKGAFQRSLCQQVEVFRHHAKTPRTQFDLAGRLFCGHVKNRACLGPASGRLQQQG